MGDCPVKRWNCRRSERSDVPAAHGDFASSERSGKVALHEADGQRNASRGRIAGPDRHIRASARLLHSAFPKRRPSIPCPTSCFGPPSNIAEELDPELVDAADRYTARCIPLTRYSTGGWCSRSQSGTIVWWPATGG